MKKHIELAEAYREKGDWQRARRFYEEHLKHHPDDLYVRARHYQSVGMSENQLVGNGCSEFSSGPMTADSWLALALFSMTAFRLNPGVCALVREARKSWENANQLEPQNSRVVRVGKEIEILEQVVKDLRAARAGSNVK